MAVTFQGSIQTVAMLGNDATAQNLFAIQNSIGSRVDVNVRRLALQMDAIGALTTFMPIVRTSRATAITGGARLDKGKGFTSTQSSDAFVTFLSQIGETSPIAATPGDTIWQQYCNRMHSTVEQQQGTDQNLIPLLVVNQDFKLQPGESLLVRVVAAAGTSNPASTNNWIVQCVWEEDARSTFNISGTVTLSAAPVAGARVMVLEADDELMTNAILREVIITGAGGTWASTILTGKVGAAFVQYKAGATYYTAPGSPFLE